MVYALFFGGIGIVVFLWGMQFAWIGWPIGWLGVSFVVVGLSYALNRADFFGKSPQGDRARWAHLLLSPYLGLTWLMWLILCQADSQPCCHQITGNIWLGRRPTVAELPSEIDLVVDLTCEFSPQSALRKRYLSLPILDHAIPRFDEFDLLVQQLAIFPGVIYVHCAAGRSRSAMTIAAILLKNGVCQTPQEAIDYIQARRSCIKLTQDQERFLAKWWNRTDQIKPWKSDR